jgi:hypothetical protein
VLPVRLLLRDRGDRRFAQVLTKLRCQKCHKPPAPVYLCAGHREFTMVLRPTGRSRWCRRLNLKGSARRSDQLRTAGR